MSAGWHAIRLHDRRSTAELSRFNRLHPGVWYMQDALFPALVFRAVTYVYRAAPEKEGRIHIAHNDSVNERNIVLLSSVCETNDFEQFQDVYTC